MSNISTKRRTRTTHINSVHKTFDNAIKGLSNLDESTICFEDLSGYHGTLVDKFSKIQTLDDEISLLLEDDAELQTDVDKATEFSIYFHKNIEKINTLMLKNKRPTNEKETLSSSKPSLLKLPSLNLTPFNGIQENWQAFFDNFICAIDKNDSLSNIQKLTYLRNSLTDSALETITGLALTSTNYPITLDLLKDRYNNKQLLITSHMNNLITLEEVSGVTDINALRKFYNLTEIQI